MNNKKQMIFCLLVFFFVAIFTGLIFAHNIIMTVLVLLALLVMLIVFVMLVQQKVLPLSLLWLFVGISVLGMVMASGWHVAQLPKNNDVANKNSPAQTAQTKKHSDKKNIPSLFKRADIKQVLLLSLLLGLLFLVSCVAVGLLDDETVETKEGIQEEKVDYPRKPILIEKEPDINIEQLKTEIKNRDVQIDSLQKESQHLSKQLKNICGFLYETSFDEHDVYVMLAERFQKVQNDFLLADHQSLEDSLLAYNRLSMYIALIKDKSYPSIFKQVKDMAFDDALLGNQFVQVDNWAVYKQICWLLFVLKYSHGQDSQLLINQIKQDIEKVDDVNKQKEFWKELQYQKPRIIIRVKGDTAYVL